MNLRFAVEVEDQVYTYTPANNGAGPLWCHGSTVLARHGDQVLVAGLETLPEHQPLHNCRWALLQRTDMGWHVLHRDATGRTREPSPVALLSRGHLLVSANPTLTEPGTYSGPAQPTVFRFDADHPAAPPSVELPRWQGEPAFTEHSHRTVTADRDNNEVLYMQNVGYDLAHMSFLHRDGQWQGVGTLAWPRGEEGDPPQPLRLCYPNVILRDRAAHFFGVGDIVEPVTAWRQAKFEITQREWDYVFRRLFYAYTPDVTSQPFGAWLEMANREATAGQMRNGDIHLDDHGVAHLIWRETNVDERLRDRFFAGERCVHTLEYMSLRDGRPVARRTLARAEEGDDVPRPQLGRFHVLADGTLIVLASFGRNRSDSELPAVSYRIGSPAADATTWTEVPFEHPMSGTFLTSTVRGGSAPGDVIDLIGYHAGAPNTLGYARVRVQQA